MEVPTEGPLMDSAEFQEQFPRLTFLGRSWPGKWSREIKGIPAAAADLDNYELLWISEVKFLQILVGESLGIDCRQCSVQSLHHRAGKAEARAGHWERQRSSRDALRLPSLSSGGMAIKEEYPTSHPHPIKHSTKPKY